MSIKKSNSRKKRHENRNYSLFINNDMLILLVILFMGSGDEFQDTNA
jgi:hypothetical protein